MDSFVPADAVQDVVGFVLKMPSLLATVVVGFLVIQIIQRTVRRVMTITNLDPILISFVNAFIGFSCWVFVISVVFAILGFPHISVAFSGSIALVIIGLTSSANLLVQDILAGVFLIAEPEFTVGRTVRVNNITGIITGLDIKKTKIRDAAGDIHVVANKTFDTSVYIIEKLGGRPDADRET